MIDETGREEPDESENGKSIFEIYSEESSADSDNAAIQALSFNIPSLGVHPEHVERFLFPLGRQAFIDKLIILARPSVTERIISSAFQSNTLHDYLTGSSAIRDLLDRNAEATKKVNESILAHSSFTSDLFKTFTQPAMDKLLAGLKPPQSFYDQIQGLGRLFLGTSKFWPEFQRWKKDHEEGLEILTAYGWWPHPNWSLSIFQEVVQLKRTRRLRHLERLICDSYDEDGYREIKETLSEWDASPEYRERRAIFRSGFNAYKRHDYIAAVSVWLPQVEGVLRANAVRSGLSPNGWKRVIRKPEQVSAAAGLESLIVGDFLRFFRALYLDADVRPPRKEFPIRRNMILHGSDLNYGRRANAMRIFLMLDTIHYFLLEYEKESRTVA